MALLTVTFQPLQWNQNGIPLSEHEINILIEIFSPVSVHYSYSVTQDGFNLGKTRFMIQDESSLRDIIWGYINGFGTPSNLVSGDNKVQPGLSLAQCLRLQSLINQWEVLSTTVVKFDEAERVKFRSSAPEEARHLVKKRIQTYIPVFTNEERENYLLGDSNIRLRS